MRLIASILLVMAGAVASAQTCTAPVNFQFAGNGSIIDNRAAGCTTLTLFYQSSGFSAVTIQLEGASGANSPGSFSALTPVMGQSNPMTSTVGSAATFDISGSAFVGWLRVHLTTATGTGTITGGMYGFRLAAIADNSGGGVIGGTCPSMEFASAIAATTAVPTCGTPAGGGSISWTEFSSLGYQNGWSDSMGFEPVRVGVSPDGSLGYILGTATTPLNAGVDTIVTLPMAAWPANPQIFTITTSSLTTQNYEISTAGVFRCDNGTAAGQNVGFVITYPLQ